MMRAVGTLDAIQLGRIDHTIAVFGTLPVMERQRKMYLLNALQRERTELIRYHSRTRLHVNLDA